MPGMKYSTRHGLHLAMAGICEFLRAIQEAMVGLMLSYPNLID
jgi:hypothetical protein